MDVQTAFGPRGDPHVAHAEDLGELVGVAEVQARDGVARVRKLDVALRERRVRHWVFVVRRDPPCTG